MRRPLSAKTATIGVTQTKLAVESELGWLFREQPTEDYGIDAQIEVVDDDVVEGRLLALQIKSGISWFGEPTTDGWWYRPDTDHVRYWTNHSLPVAVVLYHPVSKRCHWQLVNARTLVETTRGGWKVLVPEEQVLDKNARGILREAADGDPYVLRIRELQLARPWMKLLVEDNRLLVDIGEWINKTSGRGTITLSVDREDGEDPMSLASWGVFLGLSGYAEAVPKLFAWAAVSVHEETYDEWPATRGLTELFPYTNSAGEVDHWRLELKLNELGKAFLVVDQFATGIESVDALAHDASSGPRE